ncbi:MAG: hypothetical protein IIC26_04025 [Chloroflexi bacterium]|nr:hypothetical protein [Chloroflexota bacterium]
MRLDTLAALDLDATGQGCELLRRVRGVKPALALKIAVDSLAVDEIPDPFERRSALVVDSAGTLGAMPPFFNRFKVAGDTSTGRRT